MTDQIPTTQHFRCARCKSVAFSDSTWRMADKPEHRCADLHPQSGHMTPVLEPVDGGAFLEAITDHQAVIWERYRTESAKKSRRAHEQDLRAIESEEAKRVLDAIPAEVVDILADITPLMEFEGGQMGWMVKGQHVDKELFIRALYVGLLTDEVPGYRDSARHLVKHANPSDHVVHLWWRVVPQPGSGSGMYFDAVPHSRGAFMATVLEW